MDEKTFKQETKFPACTLAPWNNLVQGSDRFEVLAKIKKETIEAYGQDFTECPKRKLCFGKGCLGRPLPIKSTTFQPYLDALKKTHKVSDSGELFISNCDTCPIAKSCTSVCGQMNDYLARDSDPEPPLVFKESIDNLEPESLGDSIVEGILGKGLKIPWDSLPMARQDTVRKYLYEQKDFASIAKEQGYFDQVKAKYEFYAALTKMSRVANFRKFLTEKSSELPSRDVSILKDIFFVNRSATVVASDNGISKQAINQMINKYIDKYNLKWHTFVKKEGTKVIYHVPELMK